jgi:hypothetical protein
LGLFVYLLARFDAVTARRYDHRFLTARALAVHNLALAALVCAWTPSATEHAASFGALAAGLFVAMAARNITNTDEARGALGTLIQLLLAPALCNEMFGRRDEGAFDLFLDTQLYRRLLEGGSKIVWLPEWPGRVMSEIDWHRQSIAEAARKLPLGQRTVLRTWIESFRRVLGPLQDAA